MHASRPSQGQSGRFALRALVGVLSVLACSCSSTTLAPASHDSAENDDCVDPPLGVGSIAESVAEYESLDLAEAVPHLPSKVGAFEAQEPEIWKRGMAGHANNSLIVLYSNAEGEKALIGLDDLQDTCRCTDGLGVRRRAMWMQTGTGVETSFPPSSPAIERSNGYDIWLGDRCQMFINGSKEVTEALARKVAWSELDTLCRERAPRAP